MKRRITDLFKGFLLGLDSTIPGFSMGTLAILLNIYERLIDSFSNALKHPLRVLKNEFYIILGFIIGLVVNIFSITYLLKFFPFETGMFFVGLVLVSIPLTYKNNLSNSKIGIKEIISCIAMITLLVLVTLLNGGTIKEISFDPIFLIMLFIVGIIAAATMVIPGISGSLILLALGYYDPVLSVFKNVLTSIVTFGFDGFLVNILSFVIFLLGAILGIVFVSKGIKLLLTKYFRVTYAGIIGLLIASPFAIIYLALKENIIEFNPLVIIFSIIAFIIGGGFAILIDILDKHKNKD